MGPDFHAIRREHQRIREALRRLESCCRTDASPGAVATEIQAFLDFFRADIEPHMLREEADVYPLLQQYVPEDVGSADVMSSEHETLRGLVRLLQQAGHRLATGLAADATDASTLAQDVALLLRDHLRKEDGVINPLLERILTRAHV